MPSCDGYRLVLCHCVANLVHPNPVVGLLPVVVRVQVRHIMQLLLNWWQQHRVRNHSPHAGSLHGRTPCQHDDHAGDGLCDSKFQACAGPVLSIPGHCRWGQQAPSRCRSDDGPPDVPQGWLGRRVRSAVHRAAGQRAWLEVRVRNRRHGRDLCPGAAQPASPPEGPGGDWRLPGHCHDGGAGGVLAEWEQRWPRGRRAVTGGERCDCLLHNRLPDRQHRQPRLWVQWRSLGRLGHQRAEPSADAGRWVQGRRCHWAQCLAPVDSHRPHPRHSHVLHAAAAGPAGHHSQQLRT
mmetsp:Transcript_3655/g.6387  ORF Transcript_3655/g.6387 Transcript_3655/m.6387 type:complete len:293 (-) Transcript_3655:7595-8473(-)